MLSRLPISLAQLKAENDSEKFKNEIRQLLYPLYTDQKQFIKLWFTLFKTWKKRLWILETVKWVNLTDLN